MIEDVDISTLVNDPANVRTHDRRNLDAIKGSLAKFGQQKPIVIDAKGVVIAGNGTLTAARELGWEKIAVVRSDLAGVEATAYAIADNRTAELAAWDGKALAETIASIAIQDEDLAKLLDFPQADLDALIGMANSENETTEDATYTSKIVAPIYEPKGECPAIADLFDHTKTLQLMADIKAAKLPQDVADFLMLAAERHTSFNFRNIAEFYCHADATVQDLMERSGLVIIDFNKAIEYGFVHMTEQLGKIADLEKSERDDAA